MSFSFGEDDKMTEFDIPYYRGLPSLKVGGLSKINLIFGKYCKSEILKYISQSPKVTDLASVSEAGSLDNGYPVYIKTLQCIFGCKDNNHAYGYGKEFEACSVLAILEERFSEILLIDEINPYLFWTDYPVFWQGVIEIVKKNDLQLFVGTNHQGCWEGLAAAINISKFAGFADDVKAYRFAPGKEAVPFSANELIISRNNKIPIM